MRDSGFAFPTQFGGVGAHNPPRPPMSLPHIIVELEHSVGVGGDLQVHANSGDRGL